MAQLPTGLCSREVPLDCGAVLLSASFPRADLAHHGPRVREPSVQALSDQHRQLAFGHIQPAAVLGRVMELELLRQSRRISGGEGRAERGATVAVWPQRS